MKTVLWAMLELKRLDKAINNKATIFTANNRWETMERTPDKDYTPEIPAENKIALDAYSKIMEMAGERLRLRQQLGLANARLGIDKLLAEKSALQANLKLLQNMIRAYAYGHNVGADSVKHSPIMPTGGNYTGLLWEHTYTGCAVSKEEIEDRISVVEGRLSEIETELAAKNNFPLIEEEKEMGA